MLNVHAITCMRRERRRSDFHTWNHVELSSALHAFANAGYRIVGIDTAKLDDRPEYGMLIHMSFMLLREQATIRWTEHLQGIIVATDVNYYTIGLLCAPFVLYKLVLYKRVGK